MTCEGDLAERLVFVRGELEARLEESAVSVERPLGDLTTYRVGGAARLFVEVESRADLETVASVTADCPVPVTVVGKGSNLLVADDGFDGLAIRLGEVFADVEIEGPMVLAGGAASLPVVARRTVAAGLTGFEWAVGVPGTIGGAVRMNAGGHGSDMDASVASVHVVDLGTGDSRRMSHRELGFGYRRSAIGATHVVVDAELALERGSTAEGERLLAEIVRWRRENQPGGQNAGSVFTNPPGDSAGRLIDTAGCRGLRIGSAAVSEKHANFIQADQGGSAADVLALMVEVSRRVRDLTGVDLRPETQLLGFGAGGWPPDPGDRSEDRETREGGEQTETVSEGTTSEGTVSEEEERE